MGNGIAELGEILLARSEQRLETVSRNVSNISTPGFKREVPFMENVGDLLSGAVAEAESTADTATARELERSGGAVDFTQGALKLTGSPLDLAVAGAGFFQARSKDATFYIRGGQFTRAPDGRIATAQGLVLQTSTGEDLVLDATEVEILQDGVVLQGGAPVARIGLFNPSESSRLVAAGGGVFISPDGEMTEAPTASVRQGMLEASNVEMADEMLTMMDALRQAESGARLIRLYDSLIGQSVTTFGQTSR
jgi:flagellar basal-body rod protein FlgF